MGYVPGTQGYAASVRAFVDAARALDFRQVCKALLNYLPETPARILDAGAGVGQNSAALAEMGYFVTAVEPMPQFLSAAQNSYSHRRITWLQDSLPLLRKLGTEKERFEFILVEGVWHHLNEEERACTLKRLAHLLTPDGRCALSLRNGPPGMGTRAFPTRAHHTIQQAQGSGLQCVFRVENLPSILPNKDDVSWARIVLQKRRESCRPTESL